MRGFSLVSFKTLSSKSAINIVAFGGANLVPIVAPLNCFKVFSLN